MAVTYRKTKIIFNQEISKGIYKLIVEGSENIEPGQFYMLKANRETFLPRPISVSEKSDNQIIFLYAVIRKGTKEFSFLKEHDEISLTGPLGNGFDLNKEYGKTALVCGGIGAAPLVELAKQLRSKDKDEKIDLYAGFRDEIYLIKEFEKYVDKIYISTDTGKYGHEGFVTDIIKVEDYDTILCCGPEIMMKKVVNMCKEKGVKVYISMEKNMACGLGACLVCTCKTVEGNKRTCKDGPVFDGEYVKL